MTLQKIIIDTDPGVDDTMAIFYAMESGKFDLLGLTTIFGNVHTDLATTNALRLLEILERTDIPVAKGADNPLVRPFKGPVPYVHGDDGQGNINLPPPTIKEIDKTAAEFIVEQIMSNPGEIILAPLGPLTNIALALHLEPRITENVKEVVLMGGSAFAPGNVNPATEANVNNDPEAADNVFAAPWKVTMLGLDVTAKTWMSPDHLALYGQSDKITSQHISKIVPFYQNFMEGSYPGQKGICIHDSSVITYLLHPELYTVEQYPIVVGREGVGKGKTWAWTLAREPEQPWAGRPLVNICVDVDAKLAVERELETI